MSPAASLSSLGWHAPEPFLRQHDLDTVIHSLDHNDANLPLENVWKLYPVQDVAVRLLAYIIGWDLTTSFQESALHRIASRDNRKLWLIGGFVGNLREGENVFSLLLHLFPASSGSSP